MTVLLALLILAAVGVSRLAQWVKRRRRADKAIDAFLRDRFQTGYEIYGMTVPELLDLTDIEIELESDRRMRRRVRALNDQLNQQT
ncbi:hypothetical protein [Glycomyces tenuis]|uniref:hypothetical protein n=1 Tax=Glycomyces tenuis TaxID=58116 RepID=UPI00041F41C7|nr:hypothetical protein [Glycomyces tenuis]